MEITDVRLYTVTEGTEGQRGADEGESQYWGGGWQTGALIANPMSIYPEYKERRTTWMGPGQDPFVIEIEASDGTVGFAANYGGGQFACDVIDTHYRRFIEGSNPFNIEQIWEQMYRAQLPYGQRGVTMMAISGVDLALWDLVGKLTGQPVYNLLGGKSKEEIPCYVTTHPDVMEHMAGEGFLGVKMGAPWGPADGYREGIRKTEEIVAEARETFREDAEVMLDAYMAWDKEFTVRAAERLREYDLKWIEDPLHPGAITEYADIRHDVHPTQVAVGNLEFGYKAYHQFLDAGAGDIIQPEVQWAGGMTEVRRIADMAKAHGLPVIPHGATVYNYHFVISHTNAPYAEYLTVGDGTEIRPLFESLEGEPVPEDGVITLDDDPGFGVELNRDIIEPF
jgi:L-rhamnonate dehydratase